MQSYWGKFYKELPSMPKTELVWSYPHNLLIYTSKIMLYRFQIVWDFHFFRLCLKVRFLCLPVTLHFPFFPLNFSVITYKLADWKISSMTFLFYLPDSALIKKIRLSPKCSTIQNKRVWTINSSFPLNYMDNILCKEKMKWKRNKGRGEKRRNNEKEEWR